MMSTQGIIYQRNGSRLGADRDAGLLSFDQTVWRQSRRWKVLWLENRLDCRVWSYYCDLRRAMAKLHDLLSGSHFDAAKHAHDLDLIVVGPRMSMMILRESEPLGVSRATLARVPLVVVQNKMYSCTHGEKCGEAATKLDWAREAGAAAAFTWLTRHHEFTVRSRVPHHWMPFGVDVDLYGRFAGNVSSQTIDVAFTGTSDRLKYRASALKPTLANVTVFSRSADTRCATPSLMRSPSTAERAAGRHSLARGRPPTGVHRLAATGNAFAAWSTCSKLRAPPPQGSCTAGLARSPLHGAILSAAGVRRCGSRPQAPSGSWAPAILKSPPVARRCCCATDRHRRFGFPTVSLWKIHTVRQASGLVAALAPHLLVFE